MKTETTIRTVNGSIHGAVSNGTRTVSFVATPTLIALTTDQNLDVVKELTIACQNELEDYPFDGNLEISISPVFDA